MQSRNSFIRVNEKIRDTCSGSDFVPFVCECDRDSCFGAVWLLSIDLDALRAEERRIARPGHSIYAASHAGLPRAA